MFLVLKNNVIKYVFDVKPIFKDGVMVFPMMALDIKENEVSVVEAPQPDIEIVLGAVSYTDRYFISNETIYNEVAQRNKAVPQTITPLQAKLQLLAMGLLDEVEAMVATDRKVQLYWSEALEIKRDHQTLLQMALALGLSDAQLDEMFIEASKLS